MRLSFGTEKHCLCRVLVFPNIYLCHNFSAHALVGTHTQTHSTNTHTAQIRPLVRYAVDPGFATCFGVDLISAFVKFLLICELCDCQGVRHSLRSFLIVKFEKTRHESVVALSPEGKLHPHARKQTGFIYVRKNFGHQRRHALPDDCWHTSGLRCVKELKQLINLRHTVPPCKPVISLFQNWTEISELQNDFCKSQNCKPVANDLICSRHPGYS